MAAGGDGAAFAHAFHGAFGVRGGGVEVADFDRRHFGGAGEQVVGEGAGERPAGLLVGNLFEQSGADALHDAAVDLAFDEHRVDHRAAIPGARVIEQFYKAGLGVDRDDGAVRRIEVDAGADRGLVGGGRIDAGSAILRPPVGLFS